MHFSIAALAALAASAQAFKDTSPFLLFSSSQLPALPDGATQQLQSKARILEATKALLKDCPSELYYIVEQPAVDFNGLSYGTTPHLKKAVENSDVKARYMVSGALGLQGSDGYELAQWIEEECGAVKGGEGTIREVMKSRKGKEGVVVLKEFDALPAGERQRRESLGDNDAALYTQLLKDLQGLSYTVIYTTTPLKTPLTPETITYESSFDDPVHMDLKRDLHVRGDNSSSPDLRPLFEKYQYFSPGLFMGFIVALLLLSILSVGINAVSSLQVSYAAFDKDMGPAAQKKQ